MGPIIVPWLPLNGFKHIPMKYKGLECDIFVTTDFSLQFYSLNTFFWINTKKST